MTAEPSWRQKRKARRQRDKRSGGLWGRVLLIIILLFAAGLLLRLLGEYGF